MPTLIDTSRPVLAERVKQGLELLFDMEQRGETGPEYERWLGHWMSLLDQYEVEQVALLKAA